MKLQSTLRADKILLADRDGKVRPVLITEALPPGSEYRILQDLALYPEVAPVECSLLAVNRTLYLAAKRALQNATSVAGQSF